MCNRLSDETVRALREKWGSVQLFRSTVEANLAAGMIGPIGVPQTDAFRNLTYNLVFVFAYSALEDVLREFSDTGLVDSDSWHLYSLMRASRDTLPWQDYDLVNRGREERNDLVHERIVIPRNRCWEYIDQIETELIAWEVLEGPVQPDATIELRPSS